MQTTQDNIIAYVLLDSAKIALTVNMVVRHPPQDSVPFFFVKQILLIKKCLDNLYESSPVDRMVLALEDV